MHQPDIAPLAKRLAEENNVDWRRLHGTGDGGRVVERDVLEYLARVMAGEEAVDPTPEPVPEGMEAWPEADVHRADDDADDEFQPTVTVEDDIFLFEDAPAHDGAPAAATPGGERGGIRTVDFGPDALTDLDADAGAADIDVDADLLGDVDEDDLLVAGDGEPTPSPAAERSEAPAATPAPDAELADTFPDLFGEPDAGGAADGAPALFADPGTVPRTERWEDGPSLEDAFDQPEPASVARAGPDLALDDEPAEFEPPAPAQTPAVEAPAATGDEHAFDAAPVDPEAVPPPAAPAESPAPLAEPPAPPAQPLAAPPLAEPAPVHGVVPGTAPAALPLWSHGQVWRRHVDLSALVAAQADLASELGRDAPVPLEAFLVRAAHKALQGAGGVALALLDEHGVRTVPVPAVPDFVAQVSACETAHGTHAVVAADDPSPALIVADLSELDVDDAVLRLGAPVLALGRVLIDTHSGGRRGLLTLAGDGVAGTDAARRLARIAGLLEVPVRLLL